MVSNFSFLQAIRPSHSTHRSTSDEPALLQRLLTVFLATFDLGSPHSVVPPYTSKSSADVLLRVSPRAPVFCLALSIIQVPPTSPKTPTTLIPAITMSIRRSNGSNNKSTPNFSQSAKHFPVLDRRRCLPLLQACMQAGYQDCSCF